jgi:SAM-dependent methyltransferase
MEKYFETRLSQTNRQGADQVWKLVAADILRRLGAPVRRVLDIGAGYGDFANQVQTEERFAVDRWPGMLQHLQPGVKGVTGDILERQSALREHSFDLCFLSNVLEHFTSEEGERILGHVKAYAKPGGFLALLQPNFRFCYRRYFDDHTHKTIYTDEGLVNFLLDHGFEVFHVEPRYLPFSFKSRLPRPLWAVWLYLRSPWRPMGAQMLVLARVPK